MTRPALAAAVLALGCASSAPCTDCGGVCVDLRSDNQSCGTCNHACAPGTRCESGQCVASCTNTPCNGACVDTRNDPGNCGGCGVQCAAQHAAAACLNGTCSHLKCDDGWYDCDFDETNGCEAGLSACEVDFCGTHADGGPHDCTFYGMSDDARRVVFGSSDDDFVRHDHTGTTDVFIWDAVKGISSPTAALPIPDSGQAPYNGIAAISGDGKVVAFVQYDFTDFGPGYHLLVLDVDTGAFAPPPPDDGGFTPEAQSLRLSSDGRYLAADVYCRDGSCAGWWDRQTQTVLHSRGTPNVNQSVTLSGDGHRVGFLVFTGHGTEPWVLDTRTGAEAAAATNVDGGAIVDSFFGEDAPLLSFDGSTAALVTSAGGAGYVTYVALEGDLTLRSDGGVETYPAYAASISNDGRYLGVSWPAPGTTQAIWGVVDRVSGGLVPTSLAHAPYLPQLGHVPAAIVSGDGRSAVIYDGALQRPVIVHVRPR